MYSSDCKLASSNKSEQEHCAFRCSYAERRVDNDAFYKKYSQQQHIFLLNLIRSRLLNYYSSRVVVPIEKTYLGRIQLRESSERERNFQQRCVENPQLSKICKYLTDEINAVLAKSKLHVSHFLPAQQQILCVAAVHRTLLSTLSNERGLLVLTDQYVVYIPDCEIALGREGILDNQ